MTGRMTPAKVNRIEITLSDDKLASLDAARGLVPRAAFIKHWTEVGINTALALSSSETPEARIVADVKRGLAEAGWMREPKTAAASKPRPKAQRKGGKA